ncbi:MAG: tRNA lysidine(34) synthetase TilS, partial [Jatrophihabitantaceae bacterium]
MMGPHPAVAEVRHAVRVALTEVPGECPVLVACSGGADSLALAAATAFLAPRLGRRAGLVTVDHGLQDGSAAQAERVAALGYELGFDPVETLIVDVGVAGGPEAAAREARYGALSDVADALDAYVLLGHTLEDQAETVLLGLGRGSGPRSIAGMQAVGAGRYLRPLLQVRRASTVAACAALGLQAWEDPHNLDPSFQRVRLRREVLPLLEAVLQGGVVEALARTASLVREDLDALDAIAATIGDQLREVVGRP